VELAEVVPVLVMHTLDDRKRVVMFKKKSNNKGTKQKSNTPDKEIEDGNIQKHEKPRICLIDLEDGITQRLVDLGYNCFQGSLGSIIEVPNKEFRDKHQCLPNMKFPNNLHEYDIVIINLQTPNYAKYNFNDHCHHNCKGKKQYYLRCSYPETIFDPRALSAALLKKKLEPLLAKKSMIVVFCAPQETIEYQTISITNDTTSYEDPEEHTLYSFYSDLPHNENLSGRDTKLVVREDSVIGKLLNKHNRDLTYSIEFSHPTRWESGEHKKLKNFLPLIETANGEIVSFIHFRDKNTSLFLPTIRNTEELLVDLFERTLPSIHPALFPFSTQFVWLNEESYQLPNEKELKSRINLIQNECKEKLDEVDRELDVNRQKFSFLHDLITETGDGLVKAVEQYLNWLEFDEVTNVDETNPELKEEDLRVCIPSGLLVIEVKGIGGTSTDAECSQISKIKFRRSRERGSFDVMGLFCVNHQRYIPPHSRRNPPFNDIQIEDAENDERGLVTTYQLYNQYYNIQRNCVEKEDVRNCLCDVGLVTFTPSNAVLIETPFEIHHNGYVVIMTLYNLDIEIGTEIVIDKDGKYEQTKVEEIQDNGEMVQSAHSGEIGIKLSKPVTKNVQLWVRIPEK